MLHWRKLNDSLYEAEGEAAIYRIVQLPRSAGPDRRYVVDIDGVREMQTDHDVAGLLMYFWYVQDAKRHCGEKESGRAGFARSTSKR